MAAPASSTGSVRPPIAVLLLVGLSLAWGSNWPVMKIALGEIAVLSFRATTALGGGLALFALARLMGQTLRLEPEDRRMALVASFFNITGWFFFTGLALTLLPAGRTAVLAYTMPMFAFLSGLALGIEKSTLRRLAGLTFALGAVLLLTWDEMNRLGGSPAGVLAILAAAVSWGIGTSLQKRAWSTPVITLTAWQMILGGIPLALLGLVLEPHAFDALTMEGAVSTLYIIMVAILFGYSAWFTVVRSVSVAAASLGALPVPLIGVVTGHFLLGEPIGWPEIGGMLLVTAALMTILPTPRLRKL